MALRVSGDKVIEVRKRWFGDQTKPSYKAKLEQLDLGFSSNVDILSLTMPKGSSYTKEQVWELHFDANDTICSKLLEKLYAQGIRPAEPGEFTRRAYLNGRLSLDQAQAIASLVQAKSLLHRDQALKMMAGQRGDTLKNLKQKLLSLRAHLEVMIDFPEEPDALVSRELWRKELLELTAQMETCRQQMSSQLHLEPHLRVLVIGSANAGKSSFLKAMIPSAQPIISKEAGTTLDLVPYVMNLGDHEIYLYDAPGFKVEQGRLDQLSLMQLKEKIPSFDAFILLEHELENFEHELKLPDNRLCLKLLAKADLNSRPTTRVRWSAITREGENEIRAHLAVWAKQHQKEEQSPWWSLRLRILQCGENAIVQLHKLLCQASAQEELAAYEIDEWLDVWDGVMAEEKDSDAILDRVFREFCIGK